MNRMNRDLRAVIFDMDGVLIDSSEAHFQSWRRLGEALGCEVTQAQFRRTFGRQNRDVMPELFGGAVQPGQYDELGERKERYYREIIRGGVPAMAGAAELVRACFEAGFRCAIGSSGHPENIALAVAGLGIESYVSAIVTGRDVTMGKPNPEVFLTAAARIEVEPNACAVIEDAPAGVEAALAAGMTAVAVTSEHPRERLSHAHLIVDRLADLAPSGLMAAHRDRSAG